MGTGALGATFAECHPPVPALHAHSQGFCLPGTSLPVSLRQNWPDNLTPLTSPVAGCFFLQPSVPTSPGTGCHPNAFLPRRAWFLRGCWFGQSGADGPGFHAVPGVVSSARYNLTNSLHLAFRRIRHGPESQGCPHPPLVPMATGLTTGIGGHLPLVENTDADFEPMARPRFVTPPSHPLWQHVDAGLFRSPSALTIFCRWEPHAPCHKTLTPDQFRC
jgi:hypothetical protein